MKERNERFIEAVKNANISVLTALYDNGGVNVNYIGDIGMSALMIAAYTGNNKILHWLLETAHAEADVANSSGITALMYACNKGDYKAVEILIKYGHVNVNKVNVNGDSPLLFASEKGFDKVIELLLQSGANVELAGSNNVTPLLMAVDHEHIAAVKILLKLGHANPNVAFKNGATILAVAASKPKGIELLDILLSEGHANPDFATSPEGNTALIHVAVSGNLPATRFLVEHNANVTAVNNLGCNALTLTAHNGKYDVLQYLLDQVNGNNNKDAEPSFIHVSFDMHHFASSVYRGIEEHLSAGSFVKDLLGHVSFDFIWS